jgi:GT2 family glycosyltransferase
MQVSVIIVSYNVQAFLELCLDSVTRALDKVAGEIYVVDNNSSDGSVALVREKFPEVNLMVNRENVGFSKANNQALEMAAGAYIHFLNPDTVLPEDFYQKTLAFFKTNPQVGCLGPKLIDGKGAFAQDSKKAFPSFWISVYKVTGLSRLFKNSPHFNRYYRKDIEEGQCAEVEILSGCCLLVSRSALSSVGGGFDEAYFMYCEDVDLCHRIRLAGFRNYYFPDVTVIHYKGESTRKLSYHYMKVFYKAHALFVRKYYPKNLGTIYINALRLVLGLRNFVHWGRHLFSVFKMFLLDAILLALVTLLVKNFWFENIAQIPEYDSWSFFKTLFIFLVIWLGSLFLNGAYDKPFSLFKAGRGMVAGTLLVLAGYALFPVEYRFSRGVVLFSGMTAAIVVLLARWLLGKLKWIRLVPRGKVDYKAAVVSDAAHFLHTVSLLEAKAYHASVIGRVDPGIEPLNPDSALGLIGNIRSLQAMYAIDEFIFNAAGLSYKKIIDAMQACGKRAFFKIQAAGQLTFVGSHYEKNNAEMYFVNQKYAIDMPGAKRNKRILDIIVALALGFLFPLLSLGMKQKKGFWNNIVQVLLGKKTWVAYDREITRNTQLPLLKPGVIPPYKVLAGYEPEGDNYLLLGEFYAKNYSVWDDLPFIKKNFRYLGNR